MLRLASMHVYPVKSARGLAVTEAEVQPWGLAGDRRFMVTAPDGRFVTQRTEPRLAQVRAEYIDGPVAGSLRLCAPGMADLLVPAVPGERVAVTVWRDTVPVTDTGDAAATWLAGFLGRDLRLVYLDDPTARPVSPMYGQDTDRVSLADGFPLLLTATASLDALNGWLLESGGDPVPMDRFRPNVVVAGDGQDAVAWAEDDWRRVRIGAVTFRVSKPCARCVVTTTDQETGERGSEPLRILGQRRRLGRRLVFGQNLIPEGTGILRVGDPVVV